MIGKMYQIMFRSYYRKLGYQAFRKTCIHNRETFAILDNNHPRLYPTEKMAERDAERILDRCSNLMPDYKIIDAREGAEK